MDEIQAVGIDLGTTYSCVAVCENGAAKTLVNRSGNLTTPSFVAITGTQTIVGEEAKNSKIHPKNVIYDAKRLIGRKYEDDVVQSDIKGWSFDVIDSYGQPKVKIPIEDGFKEFFPEEISAKVLDEMKSIAEGYLGKEIRHAVISVPAYFTNSQRQATIDAAKIAGLTVLGIISEPTAAAFAYNTCTKSEEEKNILVYDLGGGTFDVSIFSTKSDKINKKTTGGDSHLGGQDFDTNLMDFAKNQFLKEYNVDIQMMNDKKRRNALRRLRHQCEIAKKTLSVADNTTINIDCFDGENDLNCLIYQAQFENINSSLFEKTIEIVKSCLTDCQMEPEDVDEIILVGGCTRIPKVQQLLQKCFNGKSLNKTVNPDEVVAQGAAIYAASLIKNKSKEIYDVLMSDMTPIGLGVESAGGLMSFVIERNTPIPVTKTKIYSTTSENQKEMLIRVFEGERPLVEDNDLLGEFELKNIPPGRRGHVRIEVTFEVDANSILTVSASGISANVQNQIEITNIKGRLSPDEITKIIEQANVSKQRDEKQRKDISAKNILLKYCFEMKAQLQDPKVKSKLNDSDITGFESNLDETISWVESAYVYDQAKYDDKKLELQNEYKNYLE